MVKNSFTLLEVILSTTILILIIGGFSNLTYYNSDDKNFQLLNNLENKFDTKDYSSFNISNQELTLIINKNETKTLNVKKYEFLNEELRLYKYEK